MKIKLNPEQKNKYSSLNKLLADIVKEKNGEFLISKVRLDGWILTYFEEQQLEKINPADYVEIEIFLENIEDFKNKTVSNFFQLVEELESMLEPSAKAFKLYDLTRANVLLEKILEGFSSALAFIDTVKPEGGKEILENSLSVLDRLVKCQEGEKYEEIGLILETEIRSLLEKCKTLF